MQRYRSLVGVLSVLPLAAAGCSAGVELEEPITAETQSLSRPCPPDTPKELKVPDGNELSLTADAEGVQVYVCKKDAASGKKKWALERPDALLFGKYGRVIAHHYEGPTWEGLDNSSVVGQRYAGVQVSSSTIDLLLLQAASHSGDGIFSKVTWIQRLNTEDGKPASESCEDRDEAARVRVPYTATYYFYVAAKGGSSGHH